jgi:transcriptional regulator with XRE-family HTH domain
MKQSGDYRRISAEVVALLTGRGMTLTDIAHMLDVTKSYVSKVKAGERSLTLDHLSQLALKTRLPLPFLLLQSMDPKALPAEARPLYRLAMRHADPRLFRKQRVTVSSTSRSRTPRTKRAA